MRVFLDSSALAKRYIEEPGTDRVVALCAEAEEILLSILCVPELISALNRRKREGKLSAQQYRSLKRELAADIAEANVMDINTEIIQETITCLEQVPVRTLDAIQIATAKQSLCDLFVTADRRQYDAAQLIKLEAELTV